MGYLIINRTICNAKKTKQNRKKLSFSEEINTIGSSCGYSDQISGKAPRIFF